MEREMTDPLEVLHWHESARERSDESFKALRKFDLVERRPAPLNLTAQEQLEFLSEYCDGYQHVAATPTTPEVYIIWSDCIQTTRGRTLTEAICQAAAKWKALNE
jgi:hypothetical protein